MGHMGAWIELKKERIPLDKSKTFKARTLRPESGAVFKGIYRAYRLQDYI